MRAHFAVTLCACAVHASEGRPGNHGKPPPQPPGHNTPPPPSHGTPPPAGPASVTPQRQACMQRCSDAGHCCTGANSTDSQPSCGQGCLAAEYYISKAPNPSDTTAINTAIKQCRAICFANGGQNKVCQWNKPGQGGPFPHELAYLNNCPAGNKCQPDASLEQSFPHAVCNAKDSYKGRECDEGCVFYLNPDKPVCAESQNNYGCVHAAGAKPILCEHGCVDWSSCQEWCQSSYNNDTTGCCSFDSKSKQCSFGPSSDGFSLQTGVLGSQAALCAPFDIGGAGGSDNVLTGGGVFLILFFVGGMTYLVGGFAYQYVRQEKRGVEAIPNVEFWKDFPHLVKDGAMYSVHQVRSKYASVRGYSSV